MFIKRVDRIVQYQIILTKSKNKNKNVRQKYLEKNGLRRQQRHWSEAGHSEAHLGVGPKGNARSRLQSQTFREESGELGLQCGPGVRDRASSVAREQPRSVRCALTRNASAMEKNRKSQALFFFLYDEVKFSCENILSKILVRKQKKKILDDEDKFCSSETLREVLDYKVKADFFGKTVLYTVKALY